MFVHEMSRAECLEVLGRAKIGRLGCAHDNQPYVVPMNFALDGDLLYGFTTLGNKVEWMRSNSSVCFEVEEVIDHNNWTSVIVFGRYEELPDRPAYERARQRAYEFLQKRAMWWEPAYVSPKHFNQPHSVTPVFFRIHIAKITGRRANSDETEAKAAHAQLD